MSQWSSNKALLLLKVILPEFKELLSKIEQGGGYLDFSNKFFDAITEDGHCHWSQLYTDKAHLKSLFYMAISDPQKIKNPEQIQESFTPEYIQSLHESVEADALNPNTAKQVLLEANPAMYGDKYWGSLLNSSEEIDRNALNVILYFIVTQLSYYISVLSFGRSICDLVADAMKGDDEAFCNAVQIDKTVLFGIPYFQQRIARAQLGREPEFLHKVALSIEKPPLRRKLKYPLLMFVFAILDDDGLLEMPLAELMAVCEELGVYGSEFGVEDVDSLRLRRKYYRERTGRQIRI